MGNKHSTTRRSKPKTTSFIYNTPMELLAIIMSDLPIKDLLTFVGTCTMLSNYYNSEEGKKLLKKLRKQQLLKERILTFESNAPGFWECHNPYREKLERRMKEAIKTSEKVTLKITDLKNSQSDDKYSQTAWVINHPLEISGLDDKTCARLDILVLNFNLSASATFVPDDSFSKKFPYLKAILLKGLIMNDEILQMLSKLRVLEFLFLHNCHLGESSFLSKLFDNCTTLKEFHIINDHSTEQIYLHIPEQLQILETKSKGPIVVNIDYSKKLRSLSVDCDYLTIQGICRHAYLTKINFACSLALENLSNLKDLFTNVKELSIDLLGCHGVFGTLSDSTTIPRSNEVPKYTFGTYSLYFLMNLDIENLTVVTYCDLDIILLALPEGKRNLTLNHYCVQRGKYMKTIYDLSQGSKIVNYSPGKEPTEKKFTPKRWAAIDKRI